MYLKASKSYQRGELEPLELVSMKTAAAREKEKATRRKTKMSVEAGELLYGDGGVEVRIVNSRRCLEAVVPARGPHISEPRRLIERESYRS